MRSAVLVLFFGMAVALAAETATPMADTGPGTKPGTTICEDPSKVYNEIFKKCLPKQGTDGFSGHPTGTAALTGQQMAGDGHQPGGQQGSGQPIGGQPIGAAGSGAGLSEDDLKTARAPIIIMPGAVRAFVPMTIFGKDIPKELAQHLEKDPKELKEKGGADRDDDDDDRTLRAEPFRGGGGFGGRVGGPGFGWGGRFGRRFGGPFGFGRFGYGGPFGFGGPFGGYGYGPFGYDPYAYAPPTVIPVPMDVSGGGGAFAGEGPRGNLTVGRLQGAGAQSGMPLHGRYRSAVPDQPQRLEGDRKAGPILIMPGAVRLDMPIVVYGADLDDKSTAAATKPEERPAEPRAPVSSGGGDTRAPVKEPVKEPAATPVKSPATEPAKVPADERGRRSGLIGADVWRNPLFADKLKGQTDCPSSAATGAEGEAVNR